MCGGDVCVLGSVIICFLLLKFFIYRVRYNGYCVMVNQLKGW